MRHRIGCAALTGLGNPSPEIIPNKNVRDEELKILLKFAAKDAYAKFFKHFGYCDVGIDCNDIVLGVEPAYQYEDLKIIRFKPNKERCSFSTGYARGDYGSRICKTEKLYRDYKYKSKFVRFIDKWHPVLYNEKRL